jgi:hypothetical protein
MKQLIYMSGYLLNCYCSICKLCVELFYPVLYNPENNTLNGECPNCKNQIIININDLKLK